MRGARLLLSWLLVLGLTGGAMGLSGCAMTGEDEGGGGSSGARDVDSVHLRNGDVVVGEVVLAGDQIRISTEYLKAMDIEKRHLESFKVLANGEIKLYTKPGDILHGSLTGDSLEVRTKTGKNLKIGLDAIEKVTFAE